MTIIVLDPKIISAPSENVVVPLGQTTLKNFSCIANGSSSVLWNLNGTRIHHNEQDSYKDLGITFYDDPFAPSGFLISMSINVTTARHNNTRLNCFAFNSTTQRNSTSSEVTLTIAGCKIILLVNEINTTILGMIPLFRSPSCATSKLSCCECHSH